MENIQVTDKKIQLIVLWRKWQTDAESPNKSVSQQLHYKTQIPMFTLPHNAVGRHCIGGCYVNVCQSENVCACVTAFWPDHYVSTALTPTHCHRLMSKHPLLDGFSSERSWTQRKKSEQREEGMSAEKYTTTDMYGGMRHSRGRLLLCESTCWYFFSYYAFKAPSGPKVICRYF